MNYKAYNDTEPISTVKKFDKLIHLLYVPTMYCNLGCQYCYLGKLTDNQLKKEDEFKTIDTLQFALNKFIGNNILPFNVSLHGGEVTSLSSATLEELYKVIEKHYLENFDYLNANNFKKNAPHIKTNLFNFDRLYDMMIQHKVSISASIDLPLSLHDKYRTTKKGRSTLKKTIKNLKLLGQYPHSAKISATLFDQHYKQPEEIIKDIWYIHKEIRFDMNNFNFMFGFNSNLNEEKLNCSNEKVINQVSELDQVTFYQKMKKAFLGTELEYGFKKNWFDEFMPSYCTSAQNCGDRFFLLQSDGNIYSCVRGQGVQPFFYGNIFTDSVDQILQKGIQKINNLHQQFGFHKDCQSCEYLHLCHTGCPFVKNESQKAKSYTCALQKEIYKDNPHSYPPAKNKEHQKLISEEYKFTNHPNNINTAPSSQRITFKLPNDLTEEKNNLKQLITSDKTLRALYSSDIFFIEVNGELSPIESQILKVRREIHNIYEDDLVKIHIRKSVFEENTNDIVNNTLFLQMLRDTYVVYGDEKRTKQEHIFSYQLFYNQLKESEKLKEDYLQFDMTNLLHLHQGTFIDGVINNLFITTNSLRDYHYKKQKENAFYHIQAINLPFQNVEFYWNS